MPTLRDNSAKRGYSAYGKIQLAGSSEKKQEQLFIKIDHCSEITLILLSNFLFFVLFAGFFSDRSDKKEATTDSIYILLTGHTELQSLLIVDRSVVCECPLDDVSLILVSAYFSFNILCYTPGCYNYFAFFEHIFFGSKSKVPPSVKHCFYRIIFPYVTPSKLNYQILIPAHTNFVDLYNL